MVEWVEKLGQLDREGIELRVRRLVQRAASFAKPTVIGQAMRVEDVLANQQSKDLVERFNDFWYSSGVGRELNWRGDQVLKNPCDLWMVVELFQRVRPAVIIETGTHRGGSASFYADMLKVLQIPATVVTIDLNPKWSFDPREKNIVSIVGYSTDSAVFEHAKAAIDTALTQHDGPVMLFLDSDHSRDNVCREMELYADFVTVGSYMVVEDTNINGHPSSPNSGPGPWEAVDDFLAARSDFEPDRECERFLLTFFPRGWIKRVR